MAHRSLFPGGHMTVSIPGRLRVRSAPLVAAAAVALVLQLATAPLALATITNLTFNRVVPLSAGGFIATVTGTLTCDPLGNPISVEVLLTENRPRDGRIQGSGQIFSQPCPTTGRLNWSTEVRANTTTGPAPWQQGQANVLVQGFQNNFCCNDFDQQVGGVVQIRK